MKDIGMTREQAEATIAREWKKFQKAFRRKDKIAEEHLSHMNREDWRQAERQGITALRVLRPIEESGIVPWLRQDTLGSIDLEHEYWAARVTSTTYDHDTMERRPIKAIAIRTPNQRLGLSRDQARKLRDQLIYELHRWDEE